MIAGVREKQLSAADGTRLCYQVRGTGPAVVFANGLGGRYPAWRHQYELFGHSHRLISWDYRGLYRSSRPADLGTLALERQVADLQAILDAEGVEKALLVGWSMGVQYSFEFYRQFPHRVSGIAALSGAAGLPFSRVLGLPASEGLLPTGARLLTPLSSLLGPITSVIGRWRGLIPLMHRLGFVAASLDESILAEIALEFGDLDFEVYLETFIRLGRHDARDILPSVDVPTAVIFGTQDRFTPVATAEEMARALPNGRLVLIPGGTHYTAAEFPDQVNEALAELAQRAFRTSV